MSCEQTDIFLEHQQEIIEESLCEHCDGEGLLGVPAYNEAGIIHDATIQECVCTIEKVHANANTE